MGLFDKKPQGQVEEPLYSTKYMGFWLHVYANRIDFKAGPGTQSIPINQIASVQVAMFGVMKITLETTGGQKYDVPTSKKREVQQAIQDAQARLASPGNNIQPNTTNDLSTLKRLREEGIITEEEYARKSRESLGL